MVVGDRRGRPGGTNGLLTMVATWFGGVVESTPSSNVMNSVPPARQAADPVIRGTKLRSQASPSATAQSCMSWHMFGMIKV